MLNLKWYQTCLSNATRASTPEGAGGSRGATWVTMERLSNGGVMFHHWYMMDSRLWDTIRDRNLCGLSHAMALGHAHGAATCTLAGGCCKAV